MNFYDAHIHFYFPFSADELKRRFCRLTEIGAAGFTALIFPEFPTELETVLKMVPGAYHPYMSLAALENQKEPFPYIESAKPLAIVPFVDARFIAEGIEGKMKRFRERGFKGLKILYVPEGDEQVRIRGMEQAFGRPVKKSEEITARLIDSASAEGMNVLFHVDLRRYGGFVRDMVMNHPRTNFNIPHFGFSRKAMSGLMETFSNCYTDTSSLIPFMEKEPESYRSFIGRYRDRIMFGSDALIGDPGFVESSRKAVERILRDRELFLRVAWENYRSFHGILGRDA